MNATSNIPKSAKPLKRADLLNALNERLDVLVIGGGIVGSSVARDAAMRGMKVALVEQHDVAYGTSSRSSRLLHGGLRYLAQGRVGLVREASMEKRVIHHIAPHLAAPLPFLFPTYADNKNWVLWQLKIGVKIYDLLCSGRNLGNSSWMNPEQLRQMVPGILTTGLNGAVRYYDGLTNDARLTIDSLRSATAYGALVVNHCKFVDAKHNGDWECELEDRLTGRTLKVKAGQVVNAAGPWAAGFKASEVKLRCTKGVHLVVAKDRVPVPETVVMAEGKRILFAIPWGDRTILGTTDTDYEGAPENVKTDLEDIKYILGVTNHFFPKSGLQPADVISAWAGLRPLIADPNGKPSDISRSHQIRMPQPGWWDVAGGKLTTCRLMAEQTVDGLVKHAGGGFQPCRTEHEPLLDPSLTKDISGILPPPFERRAVEHYVTNEWAMHLEDVMVRRTSWHYYYPDAAQKAQTVAKWMGELLGWTEQQTAAELAAYSPISSGKGAPSLVR